MMRHEEDTPDEPLLFDLPLGPERGRSAPAPISERKRARPAPQEPKPPARTEPELTFDEPEESSATSAAASAAHPAGRAGLGRRISAAGADLIVHASVAVGVLVGCRLMDVHPVLSDWPAVALFLLSFSFLYTVVPLAFWGHTPGMAWAGLDARSRDGEPLAFDQTARRWIGGILTLLFLGLPLLLAFGGRSLSDLLSGSETLSSRSAA
ncbi:MAG TPA: RDD family protein [Thermoanaerobaculia bacterium]|nr:RDD family protein [Thermoanaerobaculia bacterium]